MFPSREADRTQKNAATSRNFVRMTQTARKAIEAHNSTVRPTARRTGPEESEYLPENHSNAEYQSQPSPVTTKHKTSHQGCLAFTVVSSSVAFIFPGPGCPILSAAKGGLTLGAQLSTAKC